MLHGFGNNFNLENYTLAQISQTIIIEQELANDVSTSFAMVQASSIAPIFTMADFAKMLSKNHKTISTRIETLNRLTVMCLLVRIKLRIVQKQLIPHIKAKVIFIFILKNPISKNQKPKQNIILELCHFSIFFCKNFRNCSLVE